MRRFLFKLAGYLKIGTVEELIDRITVPELNEWLAVYRREPWDVPFELRPRPKPTPEELAAKLRVWMMGMPRAK